MNPILLDHPLAAAFFAARLFLLGPLNLLPSVGLFVLRTYTTSPETSLNWAIRLRNPEDHDLTLLLHYLYVRIPLI
ncbi:hypothetical protein M434DRAFT_401263 [Hypoxylon sp. CO27-5]|nr:hypothetical protein M434DRAFT_401263 [Hypoxylon sp. CO27-5]